MPGSSITISDEPLSSETNYRTEFVVVLNNQPQGGFANRARTPDMRVARGGYDDGFNFFGFGYNRRSAGPAYGQRQGSRAYYQPQQRWW